MFKMYVNNFFLYNSILKDVPIIPQESYGPRERDSIRLSVFPSQNYSGLFESVLNIIDVVPYVQLGQNGNFLLLKDILCVFNL